MRAMARTALVIMSVCFNIDTSLYPIVAHGYGPITTHSSCQSKDYENKERINQKCIALDTKLLASDNLVRSHQEALLELKKDWIFYLATSWGSAPSALQVPAGELRRQRDSQ
jgi:hypothetical protein